MKDLTVTFSDCEVSRNNEISATFVPMKWLILCLIGVAIVTSTTSCDSGKTEVTSNAKPDLDSLLNLYPDSVPLLVKRGEHYFKEYEYELALKDAAKAYRLNKKNQQAKLLFAEVINNRPSRTPEEVATAQTLYKQIIQKDGKNVRALVGLAATYSFQQDFEKSFKNINKALRIDRHYRDAYVLKGSNYMQLGKKDQAISSYETAVQQDPQFYEAYFFLAKIYEQDGNPQCVEYYRNAYELRPDSREIKYNLAYARQSFEDIDGATELYREMATDTVSFYANRGLFHLGYLKQFVAEDIDSAMYFYRKALQVEPRHVESWHNLGVCYDKQGDIPEALRSFGNALKYDENFELSRKYADSIRFLF